MYKMAKLLDLPKVLIRKIFSNIDYLTFCIEPSYFYLWMNYGRDIYNKNHKQPEWSNFINRAIEDFKFVTYYSYKTVKDLTDGDYYYHFDGLDLDYLLDLYLSDSTLYVKECSYELGLLSLSDVTIALDDDHYEDHGNLTNERHKYRMYGSDTVIIDRYDKNNKQSYYKKVDHYGHKFIRLIYRLHKNKKVISKEFHHDTFRYVITGY